MYLWIKASAKCPKCSFKCKVLEAKCMAWVKKRDLNEKGVKMDGNHEYSTMIVIVNNLSNDGGRDS